MLKMDALGGPSLLPRRASVFKVFSLKFNYNYSIKNNNIMVVVRPRFIYSLFNCGLFQFCLWHDIMISHE